MGFNGLRVGCTDRKRGCLCGLVTDDDIRFEGIRRDRLLHKDILAILADGSDDPVKDGVMTLPDQASTGEAVVEHMPKRLLRSKHINRYSASISASLHFLAGSCSVDLLCYHSVEITRARSGTRTK